MTWDEKVEQCKATKELFAMIKENRQKCNACPKHKFENFVIAMPGTRRHKMQCANCGGYVDPSEVLTYCQGFKAAGGNPNEIVENFE